MKNVKRRPDLLIWLCVTSAVSGIMWIIMLFALLITSMKGNATSALFPGLVIEYSHAGSIFVVTLIVLACFGLAGVLLMWKMNRAGFYMYSIIKITTYFLPVVFIGYNHLTFIGLSATSAFIFLFGVAITNPADKN